MNKPVHFYLIACLFLNSLLVAQNWQPVTPAGKYHYSISGSARLATIMGESASAGTVYLNKIVMRCDTCSHVHLSNFPYDTAFFWINHGGFLQEKVISLPGNNFCLSGSKHLLLQLSAPINAPWLFDTLKNVQASVVGSRMQNVLGTGDSVKIIVLSSSDSLLVSKNHGIIKYPLSYGQQKAYTLIGREGVAAGYQMPRFNAFFDFNVGDVFQYQHTDDNYAFTPPLFKRGVEKRTILSKQVNANGFTYQVRILKVDSMWVGSNTPSYIFSDSTAMISYVDSANDFTNLYPKQLVQFNNSFSYTFLDTIISNVECEIGPDHKTTKSIGVNCPYFLAAAPDNLYGVAYYSHTIKDLYLAMNAYLVIGRSAKEGFGITSDLFNNYDFLKQLCLSAWVKGTDTNGVIIKDELILGMKELAIKNSLAIYPNPATDFFTVHDDDLLSSISLYNGMGQHMFSMQMNSAQKDLRINTESLENGVYILVAEHQNQRRYKKITVQK